MQPNPDRGDAAEIDAVPTGLALAPDGGLYVSLLSGGPFFPETAALVHVAMDGTVTTVASGLTMLGDVTVAPDGSIYVVTMSDNFIDPAGPAAGLDRQDQSADGATPRSSVAFRSRVALHSTVRAMPTSPRWSRSQPAPRRAAWCWKCDAEAFQMMTTMPVASPEATPAG